jgi:hypothetical protein
MLNYFMGDAFGPGYSGLALLGFCYAKNQALRMPIVFYISNIKSLSRLVKPTRRRPHSGKAQIKNNLKNMILAMPSARAALVLFILKIG